MIKVTAVSDGANEYVTCDGCWKFINPHDDELFTANYIKWERFQKEKYTTKSGEEKEKDDFHEVRTPISGESLPDISVELLLGLSHCCVLFCAYRVPPPFQIVLAKIHPSPSAG